MSRWHGITPTQARAARAGLSLSADELSTHSGVSRNTISRLERNVPIGQRSAVALRKFFEARGVRFPDDSLIDSDQIGTDRLVSLIAFPR